MEGAHHVTVRMRRDYEFVAEFTDVPGRPTILLDEPPPLGKGSGPNAAAVLGAAVGNCLAASLAFCLRKARFQVDGVIARVTTHVTRNERGRYRIGAIDVELAPDLGDRLTSTERCEALFEDFCMVTASVRQGIPVTVKLGAANAARVSTLPQ